MYIMRLLPPVMEQLEIIFRNSFPLLLVIFFITAGKLLNYIYVSLRYGKKVEGDNSIGIRFLRTLGLARKPHYPGVTKLRCRLWEIEYEQVWERDSLDLLARELAIIETELKDHSYLDDPRIKDSIESAGKLHFAVLMYLSQLNKFESKKEDKKYETVVERLLRED